MMQQNAVKTAPVIKIENIPLRCYHNVNYVLGGIPGQGKTTLTARVL